MHAGEGDLIVLDPMLTHSAADVATKARYALFTSFFHRCLSRPHTLPCQTLSPHTHRGDHLAKIKAPDSEPSQPLPRSAAIDVTMTGLRARVAAAPGRLKFPGQKDHYHRKPMGSPLSLVVLHVSRLNKSCNSHPSTGELRAGLPAELRSLLDWELPEAIEEDGTGLARDLEKTPAAARL